MGGLLGAAGACGGRRGGGARSPAIAARHPRSARMLGTALGALPSAMPPATTQKKNTTHPHSWGSQEALASTPRPKRETRGVYLPLSSIAFPLGFCSPLPMVFFCFVLFSHALLNVLCPPLPSSQFQHPCESRGFHRLSAGVEVPLCAALLPTCPELGGDGGSPQLQGLAGGLHTIPHSLQVAERDARASECRGIHPGIVQQG